MRHYECAPCVWHEKPLVFDWDEETGEVSGPSASYILDVASWGSVAAHPCPGEWLFSSEPTKSKVDMAVIIGRFHRLPADLAPHYPALHDKAEERPDVVY